MKIRIIANTQKKGVLSIESLIGNTYEVDEELGGGDISIVAEGYGTILIFREEYEIISEGVEQDETSIFM